MYSKAQLQHFERHRRLKKAQDAYFKHRGPHPSLPAWSQTPRAGAYWEPAEEDSLLLMLDEALCKSEVRLGLMVLCDMARQHGRSANAIRERLILLREFYNNFEDGL